MHTLCRQRLRGVNMNPRNDIHSLVKKHRAFYEVVPHYVVLDGQTGSAATRMVQAGFDVNVYGINPSDVLATPPPDVYGLGYAELRCVVGRISKNIEHSCCLDLMPFPSKIALNVKNDAKVAAVYRIRITHWGQGQPAGEAEERALAALEGELVALHVVRR
jgi:hypothetical protein